MTSHRCQTTNSPLITVIRTDRSECKNLTGRTDVAPIVGCTVPARLFLAIKRIERYLLLLLSVPHHVVAYPRDTISLLAGSCSECNLRNEIFNSKELVKHVAN